MASPRSRLAVLATIALLGYAGIRGKLRRYEIAENSMEPTLRSGDYVVAHFRSGPAHRGDVVIFDHPAASGVELVKRVVGIPGETIDLSNGRVHVNSAVLAESWADGPTLPDDTWQLGKDEYLVLGDNRALSAADSRGIGPINASDIAWKVVARYWPLRALGRVNALPRETRDREHHQRRLPSRHDGQHDRSQ